MALSHPDTNQNWKHGRNDSDTDIRKKQRIENNINFKHFWIIHSTDSSKQLSSQNPFLINNSIKSILGSVHRNITPLRSGDLLIEVSNNRHANSIEKAKLLHNIPIVSSPHRPLNFSKSVVRHHKSKCKKPEKCSKCATIGHSDMNCQSPSMKCTNCNQDHPSYSKSCPVWMKEKQIQKIKVTQNITFSEARKIVSSSSQTTKTYASVSIDKPPKVSTKSAATQTDNNVSNNNTKIPKPSQILNSNPTTSTNNRKKSDQIKPNSSSKTTTGTSKDI